MWQSVCLLSKTILHSTVEEKATPKNHSNIIPVISLIQATSYYPTVILNSVTVNDTTIAFYLRKRAHNSCLPWLFQAVGTQWSLPTSICPVHNLDLPCLLSKLKLLCNHMIDIELGERTALSVTRIGCVTLGEHNTKPRLAFLLVLFKWHSCWKPICQNSCLLSFPVP